MLHQQKFWFGGSKEAQVFYFLTSFQEIPKHMALRECDDPRFIKHNIPVFFIRLLTVCNIASESKI